MIIHDILVAARKKIEKEENWCQRASARNIHGKPVLSNSPDAVQWCLLGSFSGAEEHYHKFQTTLLKHMSPEGTIFVSSFNDSHTHQEVLELLDKTIENCKQDS